VTLAFEREFFKLAEWWLACRLQVMGGLAVDAKHKPNLAYDLLGMVDYGWEMRLVVGKALGCPVPVFSAAVRSATCDSFQ
jgi:hypothetical protein